jgi:hypothetical protein
MVRAAAPPTISFPAGQQAADAEPERTMTVASQATLKAVVIELGDAQK